MEGGRQSPSAAAQRQALAARLYPGGRGGHALVVKSDGADALVVPSGSAPPAGASALTSSSSSSSELQEFGLSLARRGANRASVSPSRSGATSPAPLQVSTSQSLVLSGGAGKKSPSRAWSNDEDEGERKESEHVIPSAPPAASAVAPAMLEGSLFLGALGLTPEQVAEFSRGCFFYLRPRHNSNSVYELRVVEHSEINPKDYFTLSKEGVTHFTNAQAEFTAMAVWEREYRVFSRMKSIRFFSMFRLFKNLTMWKKTLKGGKRRLAGAALDKGLFVLNGRLRTSLLRVRELCLALGESRLVQIEPAHTYTLDAFCELQSAHRDKMQAQIIEFSDEVRHIVAEACDRVLDEFLLANEIVADHKMTFMERAALRTECKKLAKFIRLIEFQMNVTLVDLAYASARALSDAVNPKLKPARAVRLVEEKKKEIAIHTKNAAKAVLPLFSVTVALGGSGSGSEGPKPLVLEPAYEKFVDSLNECIANAVGTLTACERLISHEDLAPYSQVASQEGGEEPPSDSAEEVELDSIVLGQKEFRQLTATVLEDMRAAVNDAMDYAKVFEPYRDQFTENEARQSDDVATFRSVDLGVFEDLIVKFQGQENEFGGIPVSADIGILLVNSQGLKRLLLPSPLKCLAAIKELIPRIMGVELKELLADLSSAMHKAAYEPKTVPEFTEKLRFLQAMSNAEAAGSLVALGDRASHIKQLGNILERRGWAVPESETTVLRMCVDQLDQLTTQVEACEARKEEDTGRFIKMISAQVPKVNKSIASLREELDNPRIKDGAAEVDDMVRQMQALGEVQRELKEEIDSLRANQTFLDIEVTDFELMDEVAQDFKIKSDLWFGHKTWAKLTRGWLDAEFKDLDAEEMDKQAKTHQKVAFKAARSMPDSTSGAALGDQVKQVQVTLPVIVALNSAALQERHWAQIHGRVGYQIKGVPGFTLARMIELNIGEHEEFIQGVAVAAAQEKVLEDMLAKIDGIWKRTEIELKEYKEQKDVYILGSIEEIVVNLDDSLVTVATIMGSRYVGGIKEVVESWRRRLVVFQETLDEWLVCQRSWMYLETIFSAPDIQRQLPVESKKFFAIDAFWKMHMKRTNDDPNALKCCTIANLCDKFKECNETLDKIQKSLEDYLETKRAAFPRFYFLANDELLEILAQTKDPQAVQPHLRKCFDALVALDFGSKPGSIDIEAMISPEGERIELGKNLKARGNVEDWLTAVESNMKTSLQKLMKVGLLDYPTKRRKQWVLEHPGQIVATAAQMTWVVGTEAALRDKQDALKAVRAWYKTNLDELQALIELIRGDLTKRQRLVVVALVTTDVHARDIILTLVEDEVAEVSNFTWQMQLRYCWDADVDDCRVRHSDAVMNFGYEYMGCTTRLVITPLTDRCWMTITGSYGLKLGAAPAGPAGTGKTESSKDLAKAIGVQCIVFNCSDQIDYKMMGRLFRGLAQTGSWVCLDEFNRIDIEVLSVIAQQLLVLRLGRIEKKQRISFMGVDIALKDHHVIVTMNPGYAGRTELPDNLKVCFRPVSMMVPDYALIAEIMLFAEGFGDAKTLSRKMIKLFHLSSQQLSQQPHYDYGLRAVKSVLVMAGGLKRGSPGVPEDVTLIRALRDSNVPKCLSEDLPLFSAIVSDLFPGVVVPVNDYGMFQVVIEEEIRKANLQVVPAFITKVIQQYDMFNVRFGATIVGPAGAGKSMCWRILVASMSNMRKRGVKDERYQHVEYEILNPKCITMGELYGEFNKLTQEWHDGLASTIMRRAVGACDGTNEVKRWTVFDGPIDALWIENMNTVLDDNLTLCLANGERIKLKTQMKCLFEVMDLAVASPATVSRLGVMYMSPEDLGWRPPVLTWLASGALPAATPQYAKDHLLSNFDEFVDKALRYVRRNCNEPVVTLNGDLVTALCKLFESLFRPEMGVRLFDAAAKQQQQEGDAKAAPVKEADVKKLIDKLFMFSLVWGVGGSIQYDGWEGFDQMVREAFDAADRKVQLPMNGLVYDFFVDCAKDTWVNFEEIIPSFEYSSTVPYFQLLVPSVDTTRYSYVIRQLMKRDRPVFLTGVTGTGKTSVISDTLARAQPLPDESPLGMGVQTILIGFSAQTKSIVVQETIEAKLEKKRKTLLGAPANRRVVVFVDDINMPLVEEYGAQPPVELLRQFLDHKGFYDRDKLFWKEIENTMLMVAAAPPGGGRNVVTPRFQRHFNVLCMRAASSKTMQHIFASILGGYAAGFKNEANKDLVNPIVASVVEIYARISAELLPTPAKSHYTFNLRDISKVFQGILMMAPSKCPDPDTFAMLFVHESQRVFHDRLINREDKRWFTNLLIELLTKQCRLDYSHEKLFEGEWPLMFCDFLRPGLALEERMYELAKDPAKMRAVLEDNLDEYNMSNPSQMNLVFFKDAIEHIARIARIIRQPRGNALLIGVGGSGRQSCTRLAAFMAEFECFQIELVRGYGVNEFHEDIKNLMVKTGVKGKHTVFLFTDTQIVEETFVEDINNVLNSGEIPNLFPQDEMDRIINDMVPVLKEMGLPETRENCRLQFIARVRDLLHIVLCMSPVGDSLRVRCRNFPSLINCTTIDWYLEWPKSALESVAKRFLAELDVTADTREALVQMCGEIHTSVIDMSNEFFQLLRRRIYTTPKSYLDLIDLYRTMLSEKRGELATIKARMEVGVTKLNETNKIVDDLQAELVKLQPVLVVKSKETEELIVRVNRDKAEAAVVEERVAKDEAVVKVKAAEVAAVQTDAQADLDKALPALNSALKALDALDKKDITEIKSFAKPPPAVQTVMEAICLLFNVKPDWDNSKKLLGDTNFMKNLQEYDKDNIDPAVIKKVKKYTAMEIMAVDNVKKVSVAATSLCMFVHAMDIYSDVAKEVAPKMATLQAMNAQMKEANTLLATKQAELQAVRDKVAVLQKQLDETLAAKKALEDQSQLTKDRLVRAEKLTNGLSSEGVRWKQTLVNIEADMKLLTGDVMVSSGCISYYGAFTGPYRERLVRQWAAKCKELGIPTTESVSLQSTMGNAVQLRAWQIDGLPTDDVSADSALLVARGKRWPLMIDPQSQANRWIKNTESVNNLEVIKMNNPNLLRSMENGIRVGRPVLVEDVEERIDPALEPILQKAVFVQGGRKLIHLGDSDIDYDDNFKFYMTTKMPNPHYLPEVCIKVTLINFTVTFVGLTDQLLGDVVKAERPDVEERKNKLVTTMAADAKQLKDLEAKILKLLSESKGNILDDEVLINTLADSKTTSSIIHERVEESKKTQATIEQARATYRGVAVRGSIIYFVIADLAQIDPMYQYSLKYYQALFNVCLRQAPASKDFATRIKNLLDFQTSYVFANVSRGLFETHKSLFAALICFQIQMLEKSAVSRQEFMFMLRGAGIVAREGFPALPAAAVTADLLSEAQWDSIIALDRDISVDDLEAARALAEAAAAAAAKEAEAAKDAPPPPQEEEQRKGRKGGKDKGHAKAEDPKAAAAAAAGAQRAPQRRPFEGLAQSIAGKFEEGWRAWLNSSDPYNTTLPDGFQSKLNDFQRLMLVKVCKEDKMLLSLSSFVDKYQGRNFVEFPPVQMEEVYATTNSYTPLIFVLSQGADPTAMLVKFAKEKGYGERLHVISLGQGQGPAAERLIEASVKNGDWVLLQNCHLARSWMPSLEKIVLRLADDKDVINANFRLYLTSFPATYFPVAVLQNGVKLTNEPPKGLRANLIRTFDNNIVTARLWEDCRKPREWKKLLMGLAFFHGVVQERRKFGPLGWNIRYEFNDTDLETSVAVLQRFLNEQDQVPWDALTYVTGQINYGGRVTDDWDRRCLMGVLKRYLRDSILDDAYKFSDSGLYYAPPQGSFEEIQAYLKELPMADDPEVFGMHRNAEITFQKAECFKTINAMLMLQPRETGGGGGGAKSADDIVMDLSKQLIADMPAVLDTEKAGPTTFVRLPSGLISSLDTVLSQEIVKFNRLLKKMSSSLKELGKAIKGLVVMSKDLDLMYQAFLTNRVPKLWPSFASRKPLMSFFQDLCGRVEFLRTWLYKGQPAVFPLHAFFFPQGFLTGVLQTHSRKYQLAVDELNFASDIVNVDAAVLTEGPEDGVYMEGLNLEGARFCRTTERIQPSLPNQMYVPLPPVHLVPKRGYKADLKKLYECPVYKTSDRQGVLSTTGMSTNFVLSIYIKSDVDPQTWIMTGSACLLNLDT